MSRHLREAIAQAEANWYPYDGQRRCRRAILDTGTAWYAPLETLAQMRSRGLLLSISPVAFVERLAAVREETTQAKLGRARRLADHLDPRLPIAPLGGALERQLGIRVQGDVAARSVAAFDGAVVLWQTLVERSLPGTWRDICVAADEWLDASAAAWRSPLEHFRSSEIRDFMRQNEALARTRTTETFARMLARSWRLPGHPRLRGHAWCAIQASHLVEAAKGAAAPVENHRQDLRLAQHFVVPAFVVTQDRRFIQRLGAIGTPAAAWLRTPDEMVSTDLPIGPPWGEAAAAQSSACTRFVRG